MRGSILSYYPRYLRLISNIFEMLRIAIHTIQRLPYQAGRDTLYRCVRENYMWFMDYFFFCIYNPIRYAGLVLVIVSTCARENPALTKEQIVERMASRGLGNPACPMSVEMNVRSGVILAKLMNAVSFMVMNCGIAVPGPQKRGRQHNSINPPKSAICLI